MAQQNYNVVPFPAAVQNFIIQNYVHQQQHQLIPGAVAGGGGLVAPADAGGPAAPVPVPEGGINWFFDAVNYHNTA